MIRIGLAQINPVVGDVQRNLEKVFDFAERARASNVDALAFPELTLIGYPPKDLLFDARLLNAQDEAIQKIVEYSQNHDAVLLIGVALRNHERGKPLFNAILAIKQGGIVRTYRKQLLPTYDVFDERRYFEAGPTDAAWLEIKGSKLGLLICEDGWNATGVDYATDPLAELKSAGVDLIVSINASPFALGKSAVRESTLMRADLPIAYVNQVGGNDDLVFDGQSFFGERGTVITKLPGVGEGLLLADLNDKTLVAITPCEPAHEELRQLFDALSLGLKDYLGKTGFNSVVVGSSGGIDSALVIALCALVLGSDRVTAITMPSIHSSAGSVSDSRELCKRLNVRLIEHPIQAVVESFANGYVAAFGNHIQGVAAENLQARVRGTILMEYSNSFGSLLVSTGNKSEMSVGYCTLYGDTNGGISLIGDLFKTDVYRLAHWINQQFGAVIPTSILDKEPSAELAPNQRDRDSLPPYEVLDALLKDILEGGPTAPTSLQTLRPRIEAMLARAEYKRRQAPPIIKVRPVSFGPGRQYPIAARYPQ